ncbi:MAG: hypothetical protein ACRDD7_00680 [Peptostreptococcaceae bacterium]
MVVYDENNVLKQKEILNKLVDVDSSISLLDEYKAQKLVLETLRQVKSDNGLENFNISTFIKDTTLVKWKSQPKRDSDHFVKIFFNELNHAKEKYQLTQLEVNFIYSISEFLSWESNLLIDKEGKPMNQKALCLNSGMNRNKVSSTVKSLEEKKCLIRIWDGRDIYYLVNPFLVYKGMNINKGIPKLFEMIGYECLNKKDISKL